MTRERRRFCSLALLVASGCCVDAARITRKQHHRTDEAKLVGGAPQAKLVAGVPVLNYHQAHDGLIASGGVAAQELELLEEDWVVVLNSQTTSDQIDALCKSSRLGCRLTGHPSQGGVPFLEIRGTEVDLEAVLAAAGSAAKFVERDTTVHLIPELDDHEVDVMTASWGLARVGTPDRGAARGQGAHVYVFDTGVRATHTDFGGRVVPTLDLTSGSLKECGGDLQCAGDVQGHGTHCAGTAAGTRYGVAPEALVHSVKVLSNSGSGTWGWTVSALDWVGYAGQRPAIASMSLGGWGTPNSMKVAVDTAVNAGVVVVVAAGNNDNDACSFSPAFVPSAITVGSTNENDYRSSFSNFGPCTDIWAPGSNIVSASNRGDNLARSLSGTSMACPHVAGGAALLLGAQPGLSPAQVLDRLQSNGIHDYVGLLTARDNNIFLYVAEGGAPPTPAPAPTPAPPPAPTCPSEYSIGPDSYGDCLCNEGLYCYQAGDAECEFSFTERYGWLSNAYFLAGCTDCECK